MSWNESRIGCGNVSAREGFYLYLANRGSRYLWRGRQKSAILQPLDGEVVRWYFLYGWRESLVTSSFALLCFELSGLLLFGFGATCTTGLHVVGVRVYIESIPDRRGWLVVYCACC